MSDIVIQPAKQLRGVLRVPSDRSITVRAALLAAIADGTSHIRQPLACDDTDACISAVQTLGTHIERAPNEIHVHGVGLRGLKLATPSQLFCGSSGATMRLLSGLMAGQAFDSVLDGTTQLRKRPMRRISEPLRLMGAQIADNEGCAPLHITGQQRSLRSVRYATPVASAQVKSAILLAGLYAGGETIVTEEAPTRDHTERMLRAMGVGVRQWREDGRYAIGVTPVSQLAPLDLMVPADLSSAAFFMVAACIVPHARVTLREVGVNETRTGLLDGLRSMGAHIEIHNAREEGNEPIADLSISADGLRGIEVSGELTARSIDELPILAVAATQARGRTLVRNAEELRVKESNRLEGYVAELRKLGAAIEITADGFAVQGPTPLRGAVVDGLGDHRVAMSLAVAALVAQGDTTILGADCVSKTYPTFFEDLNKLRNVAA